MDFSNFISKFNASSNNMDASNIDLMTTVSNSVKLIYNDGGGGPYYGRYFCVGNLLVQFSDFSTQAQDPSGITLSNYASFYTLSFPNPYETIPYCVMPYVVRPGYQPGKSTDNNWGAVATLSYMTEQNFSFRLSNYAAGIGFLSIGPRPSFFYNTPPPFYTTGGGVQYISGYYVITFYSSGLITFSTDIIGVSVICVGGGGGGGGASFGGGIPFTGPGGGGGGNWQTSDNFTAQTYTITVGKGGTGGTGGSPGGDGKTSSVKTTDDSDIVVCTGGGGGDGGTTSTPGSAGYNSFPSNNYGSGGQGGNANATNGNKGNNSASYSNENITVPTNLQYYIKSKYCGGGAGAGLSNTIGGGSGIDGLGGNPNTHSSTFNGENATTPGSGGGGGCYNQSTGTNTTGGNGADGIVIMYFEYPNVPYFIFDSSGVKITTINNNDYTGLIVETTSQNQGTANIAFSVSSINVLIVGGGGGGAAGTYNTFNSGGGGGGGGIIYNNDLNANYNTFNITVGNGGLGRQATNPPAGSAAGFPGNKSSIICNETGLNLTAEGGGQGLGVGSTSVGGGAGGNANNNNLNNNGGGGGGGGGGCATMGTQNINNANATTGKLNSNSNPGSLGTNGSSSSGNGGQGGNSYYSSGIPLPCLPTNSSVYVGNGGGGGSEKNGGKAGFTTGGTGYGASNTNGQNAISGLNSGNYYYGNGGGGGAIVSSTQNYGGNGANGVVIIWWEN
jgi:hypothetical protein